MVADGMQQRRMDDIEAELPVGLHQQRELLVLLEAGGVLAAAARRPDLHFLTFAAQADIMLALWMCRGNRILEQFAWSKKQRATFLQGVLFTLLSSTEFLHARVTQNSGLLAPSSGRKSLVYPTEVTLFQM